MMKIWSLIAHGMSRDTIEVSIEQAIDNYMNIFHSIDEKVNILVLYDVTLPYYICTYILYISNMIQNVLMMALKCLAMW